MITDPPAHGNISQSASPRVEADGRTVWTGCTAILQAMRRFGLRLEEDPALGKKTDQIITRLAIRISKCGTLIPILVALNSRM